MIPTDAEMASPLKVNKIWILMIHFQFQRFDHSFPQGELEELRGFGGSSGDAFVAATVLGVCPLAIAISSPFPIPEVIIAVQRPIFLFYAAEKPPPCPLLPLYKPKRQVTSSRITR